jgi:hypothetical protein
MHHTHALASSARRHHRQKPQKKRFFPHKRTRTMAHTGPANRLDIPLFDEFVLGATRETSNSSTTAEEHKNRGNVAYRKKEYEEVRSQTISRHPSDSFRSRTRPSNRALTVPRARSRTHTHRR